MARTALQLQSGRKYIYNVSSFVRGLSPIVTPWYAIKSWNKNIFNGLLVLLLALCAHIISLILEAKWSPSAPLWTYEPASSWLCLLPTLQWPRQLKVGQHQHQHQGHHYQGDLETDKASPPAPAADEEEERTREKREKVTNLKWDLDLEQIFLQTKSGMFWQLQWLLITIKE